MGDCLRPLMPSWRFFDKTVSFPTLYARIVDSDRPNQEWNLVLSTPKLRWFSLFLNPDGNLRHAYCNALEQLVRHPECQQARYIIDRLVRRFLLDQSQQFAQGHYQFKVTVFQMRGEQLVEEECLLGEGEF